MSVIKLRKIIEYLEGTELDYEKIEKKDISSRSILQLVINNGSEYVKLNNYVWYDYSKNKNSEYIYNDRKTIEFEIVRMFDIQSNFRIITNKKYSAKIIVLNDQEKNFDEYYFLYNCFWYKSVRIIVNFDEQLEDDDNFKIVSDTYLFDNKFRDKLIQLYDNLSMYITDFLK